MVGKQSNPFELNQADNSSQPEELGEESSQLIASLEKSRSRSLWSKAKSWRWLWVSVSVFGVVSSIGVAALWLITTPPPSADCQKISSLSTDREQLYCTQESARSGELPKVLAGMDTLNRWAPDHPLYREAQRLIAEWSQPVLTAARDRIAQSDLTGAVELASRIPKTSPLYAEAQAEITKWQQFWQKGEAIATAIQTALKAQQWDVAAAKIGLLREFKQDYWRYERPNALAQQLESEQRSRRYFAQAQEVAKPNQPDQLGSAIAMVSRMDTKTHAWSDAQKLLSQWSETLLSLSYQNWVKGNLAQSMTLAKLVMPNPKLTQTAQDLIWLGQARSHSLGSRTTLKPTLPQLWNLTAAIATADLLQPNSRYYPQAQANLISWKAQFQDLSLLQLGWAVGSVPYPQAFQLALWHGQQITRDRPRRAQAQTLLAYWQQELLKSEDLPYLAYARKLANKRSIPALKAAIAQANVVQIGRPLHPEARTLMAGWTGNIQTIQDQPTLDRALALAAQGNLNGAIQAAAGIAPNRSLYEQAQGAIGSWQAEIRAIELAEIRAQEEARERSRRSLKETPSETENTSDERFPSGSEYSSPNEADSSTDQPSTPETSDRAIPYQPYTPPPRRSFTAPSPESAPPLAEPAPPPTEPASPVYEPYEPAPLSR